jgi:hypothetical protein
MRLHGHVARIVDFKNDENILAIESEGKRPPEERRHRC